MSPASVRSRILAGAALWTVGLFTGAILLWGLLVIHQPHSPVRLHRVAMQHGYVLWLVISVSMIAGLLLVRRAVSPLARLRERLAAVRSGREPRVLGEYPAEVQPLVDDLNVLLEHQEQAVRRAVTKAGDLAHGLKTPLAVLTQEAERAGAAGLPEVAAGIREQIAGMQRQVDYHLAHARAAASGATPGATSSVRESVDGIVRTLERLYLDRQLEYEIHIDPQIRARVQREDLDEMLGNLLDNARKWSRSRVVVRAAAEGGEVAISVEDNGPGVPEGMRERVLQRGVRADEAAPGSGFGLSIVRELAALYGGGIALETASTGGVRAVLRLPAAAPGVRA